MFFTFSQLSRVDLIKTFHFLTFIKLCAKMWEYVWVSDYKDGRVRVTKNVVLKLLS